MEEIEIMSNGRPNVLIACNNRVRQEYLDKGDLGRLEQFADGTGSSARVGISTIPTRIRRRPRNWESVWPILTAWWYAMVVPP